MPPVAVDAAKIASTFNQVSFTLKNADNNNPNLQNDSEAVQLLPSTRPAQGTMNQASFAITNRAFRGTRLRKLGNKKSQEATKKSSDNVEKQSHLKGTATQPSVQFSQETTALKKQSRFSNNISSMETKIYSPNFSQHESNHQT